MFSRLTLAVVLALAARAKGHPAALACGDPRIRDGSKLMGIAPTHGDALVVKLTDKAGAVVAAFTPGQAVNVVASGWAADAYIAFGVSGLDAAAGNGTLTLHGAANPKGLLAKCGSQVITPTLPAGSPLPRNLSATWMPPKGATGNATFSLLASAGPGAGGYVQLRTVTVEGPKGPAPPPSPTPTPPAPGPTPSPPAPSEPCKCCKQVCEQALKDVAGSETRFSLSWRIEEASQTALVSLQVEHMGWVALGLSSSGGMVDYGSPSKGSWAVIGKTAASGAEADPRVAQYLIAGYTADQIKPIPAASLAGAALLQSSVAQFPSEKRTVLSFTRSIHGAGVDVPALHVGGNSTGDTIIFAAGQGDGWGKQHQYWGAAKVDWYSGAAVAPDTGVGMTPFLIVLHGALMLGAWALTLPLGILIARFGKGWKGVWFHSHRALQTLGVVAAVAAAVAIFVAKGETGAPHFSGLHGKLGLGVMVVALLQPLNGFLRPHAPHTGEVKGITRMVWESVHGKLGYTLLALAWVNIALGLQLAPLENAAPHARSVMTVAFVALACLLSLVFLVAEHRRLAQQVDKQINESLARRQLADPLILGDSHLLP